MTLFYAFDGNGGMLRGIWLDRRHNGKALRRNTWPGLAVRLSHDKEHEGRPGGEHVDEGHEFQAEGDDELPTEAEDEEKDDGDDAIFDPVEGGHSAFGHNGEEGPVDQIGGDGDAEGEELAGSRGLGGLQEAWWIGLGH